MAAPERGELVEALVDVLNERLRVRGGMGARAVARLAIALLPVVEAHARRVAVEELRAAANELHLRRFNDADDRGPDRRWPPGADRAIPTWYAGIVHARSYLRSQAAALESK